MKKHGKHRALYPSIAGLLCALVPWIVIPPLISVPRIFYFNFLSDHSGIATVLAWAGAALLVYGCFVLRKNSAYRKTTAMTLVQAGTAVVVILHVLLWLRGISITALLSNLFFCGGHLAVLVGIVMLGALSDEERHTAGEQAAEAIKEVPLPPSFQEPIILTAVAMSVIFVFLGVSLLFKGVSGSASAWLLLIATSIPGLLIISKHVRYRTYLKEKENAVNAEIALRGFTLVTAKSYYQACANAGIKDIQDPIQRQRALQLAQSKFYIPDVGNKFAEMFAAGEQEIVGAQNAEKEKVRLAQLEKLRADEAKRMETEQHIASLSDRDKPLYILHKQLDAAQLQLKILRDTKMAGIRAAAVMGQVFAEKERGWGVSAGIASGIAGNAAATAVALDIMAENRDIRQRNNALAQSFKEEAMQCALTDRGEGDLRSIKTRLEQDIEKTILKIADHSHDIGELFASLEATNPIVSKASKSGAITISVIVKATKPFKVQGLQKTVLDGSLVARVCADDNTEAGLAYLTFPLNGIDVGTSVELSGICTATQAGKRYHVELHPKALWLLEA